MGENLKLLLISPDAEIIASARLILERIGDLDFSFRHARVEGGRSIIQKFSPDILLLPLDPVEMEKEMEISQDILIRQPGLSLFFMSRNQDPQTLRAALKVGAKDFLSLPIQAEELRGAIERVREAKISQIGVETKKPHGKVVSVIGSAGGVGSTTIAVNLAHSLTLVEEKVRVALLDLNLQFGHLHLFLDLTPKITLFDFVRDIERVDQTFLETGLARHSSGIYLLGSSQDVGESENIQVSHVEKLLTLFKASYDYILIDTDRYVTDLTVKALDLSDEIILVTQLTIPALHNAKKYLILFDRLGYSSGKIKILLNRHQKDTGFSLSEVEKTLSHKFYYKIPNNFAKVELSINQGIPLVNGKSNDNISNSFITVAEMLSKLKIKKKKSILGFLPRLSATSRGGGK